MNTDSSEEPGPLVPLSALVPTRSSARDAPPPHVPRSRRHTNAGLIILWFGVFLAVAMWGLWMLVPALALHSLWEAWPRLMNARRQQPELRHTLRQCALADQGEFEELVEAAEHRFRVVAGGEPAEFALHDLGYWELRAGGLERALAILSEMHRRADRGGHWNDASRTNVRNNLATTYAAIGDAEAARSWLPEDDDPSISPARSVVAARQGDFDELAALTYPEPTKKQQAILGHGQRVFYLMQLFGAATVSPEAPLPAHEIARARPVSMAEYGYLTMHWPALRAFVEKTFDSRRAPGENVLPEARVV